MTLAADGYEAEGGRGVTASTSMLVSPLPYLVGVKADGDLHYVHKGAARRLELVAVDPALKQIAADGVIAEVLERKYVSVLARQADDTFKYQSVLKETKVGEKPVTLAANGGHLDLATQAPGDFVLVLRSAQGDELNRVEYSVVGAANLTRSLEKNAELEIALSKGDFEPGEEIEVQIKAPYTGAGLITIERDRVYAHQWFKASTTATTQKIRVPKELEGNGYVGVTFVRAMDSPEIFMSPLSYGVAPFMVSRARHALKVDVEAPDLVRPGNALKIKYKTDKPAKIALFAVDQGILQVAGYRTPDPLGYFFRKRALEVRTIQLLDLILPEFKLLQQKSASGGDAGQGAIGQNLNPFKRKRDKPAVYWSGIIDSGVDLKEVSYEVPETFAGTLKIFAVAVSESAVGVSEKQSLVRGHFVLTPNLPTFAAPGDEFSVSVGVANNVEGAGAGAEVKLTVTGSAGLEVQDAKERTLKIGEGREGAETFKIKAKDVLGSAGLSFQARLGDKQAKLSADLSVRPPVPFNTTIQAGLARDESVTRPLDRRMYAEYRTREAAVSVLPTSMARGLLLYLENYPYGCTEQLVSQAFSRLFYKNRPELGLVPKNVDAQLEHVLKVLRARQAEDGAFGLWAAASDGNPMVSAYAVHFLLEMKERGEAVPKEMLQAGLGHLRRLSEPLTPSTNDLRVAAYATYLLARAGIVVNTASAIRAQLEKKKETQDLAAIYLAAAFKLHKQTGEGERLIDRVKLGEPQKVDYTYLYDGLARDAQLVDVLSRYFPERLKRVEPETLRGFAEAIANGGYNSYSSSLTLIALDAYAKAFAAQVNGAPFALFELDKDKKASALALANRFFSRAKLGDSAVALRFENGQKFPMFWQVTEAGFDLMPPKAEIKERLEVSREYYKDGKPVTSARLGEELEVHVRVRAMRDGFLPQLAIVDLLPGGFEPSLDSLGRGQGENPSGDEAGAAPEGRYEGEGDEGAPADGGDAAAGEGEAPSGSAAPRPAMRPQAVSAQIARGLPGSTFAPEYVDIREDRVVLYGAALPQAREFIYRIRATNRGRYRVPPIFGESMYDRTVKARGLGGEITVE